MARCICDWESTCGGTGVLRCRGCGGDLCICVCGGEDECPGCLYCDEYDGLDDEYDDDDGD